MKPQSPPSATPPRLMSLDALRGFDMFWIAGGATIFRAFTEHTDNKLLQTLRLQFEHVQWEGFRFYDLIFPLFLFLIGVAIPFALSKRFERGEPRSRIYRHILSRVAILIFFGMMINGNLLSYGPREFQITYSVLQMLALGYLVASIVWLNLGLRWQIAVTLGLLVGYWALQTFVPVPGYGAGVYREHALFGDWLNDRLLGEWQGRWRFGWILGIMTHASTAMLGVLAGQILRSAWRERTKVTALAVLGLGCLAVGWLWSYQFPIIKNRWTSTFALWAGGWSYLLLALFYQVIDVWQYRRWAYPFMVLGTNSIFVYMAWGLCNGAFKAVADCFLGGLAAYTGPWQSGIAWTGAFFVSWLLLAYMYRNKTFLRV
ncbi:MAG: acyltransferase family protein [Thermoguttaceae bacterium]